eukprot:437713-Rhodomonas_salina.1
MPVGEEGETLGGLVHPEIKYKKPQFPSNLHQQCFLYLKGERPSTGCACTGHRAYAEESASAHHGWHRVQLYSTRLGRSTYRTPRTRIGATQADKTHIHETAFLVQIVQRGQIRRRHLGFDVSETVGWNSVVVIEGFERARYRAHDPALPPFSKDARSVT